MMFENDTTRLRRPGGRAAVLPLILCLMGTSAGAGIDMAYRKRIDEWRAQREAQLKADDGWLAVSGLYWLKEGENRFGSDNTNDIVLPESAPSEVGVFDYRGKGRTIVRIRNGVTVLMDGRPVSQAELKPDVRENRLIIGPLTLVVHASGERYGIRMWNWNSRIRREFTGCKWFPVDEAWRIEGRFVPHGTPRTVHTPNIVGDLETFTSNGDVVFNIKGQEFRMQAISSGGELWFIMRDLTSGRETYPTARFLYTDAPRDGKVILDFNQAQNPPCAFNPYTTCPLPPEQNRLRIRIEAGELNTQGELVPSANKPR